MAEFNLPLWQVYKLAAAYAIKEWGEWRILAGLDCYTDEQITAYQNRTKSEIDAFKTAVAYWRELESELRSKSDELYKEWRKEQNLHG